MTREAFEWNVVVLGAWNPAILTPAGIAKRLFKIEADAPLQIQVPIDMQGPLRVTHSNVTVIPSRGSLVVEPLLPRLDTLCAAAEIAVRAIGSLPETPLSAAGINFRYRYSPIPEPLLDILASVLDTALADGDYSVATRAAKRSLRWERGLINIDLTEAEDSTATLLFNCHRDSAVHADLSQWLGRADQMHSLMQQLLTTCFKLNERDHPDGAAR